MTLQAIALAVLTFLLSSCLVVMIYCMVVYRGLTAVKRELDRAYLNLDALLQERFEASGELMELCRGFVPRDSRPVRELAQIRSMWAIANNKTDRLKSAADSDRAMKNLLAAAQAVPELSSTEYFDRVEKRLIGIEQQVADRREKYNSSINGFNERLEQFPVRWMSGFTGFTAQPYFGVYTPVRNAAFGVRQDSPNA
ncbi:MAG TPA: LemA family protein [Candidatus Acidoferrales bacterium]|nr:LemA family protein [Candidatus Acidoferrales bacterium]